MSWSRTSGEVDLFFNRDEQRDRVAALPPRQDERGVTAPVDPQGGGTWIFVNRHALCGVLLNRYADAFAPSSPPRSRGLLMRELGPVKDAAEFEEKLREELNTHLTAPCLIGCVALRTERFWQWDGQRLRSREIEIPMLTTSGYRAEEVAEERLRYFQALAADPQHPRTEELESFHGWRDPERPAYSTVMARSDARTVSRTRVHLRVNGSRMRYEALVDPIRLIPRGPTAGEPRQ